MNEHATPSGPDDLDVEDLARSLARLLHPETRTIVRLDPDECTLVEFRSTGRLRQASMHVGEATYTADVPEVAAHRAGRAKTLHALAETYGRPQPPGSPDTGGSDSAALAAAVDEDRLLTKAAALRVRDAALTEMLTALLTERILLAAHAAPPIPPGARRACMNCDGAGEHVRDDCECSMNGQHYLGVLAQSDDLITDEPSQVPLGICHADGPAQDLGADQAAVHDPDCVECHGTGTYRWTCPVCKGTGREASCLDWEITGPDGMLRVRLDAAALLRDGDARILVRTYSADRHVQVLVSLDCTALIARMEAAVAAGQPTWRRRGPYFSDWPVLHSTMLELTVKPTGSTQRGVGATASSDAHSGRGVPFLYALDERFAHRGKRRRDAATRWVPVEGIDALMPSGTDLIDLLQIQMSQPPWFSPQEAPAAGPDGIIATLPYSAVVRLPAGVLLRSALLTAHDAGYGLGLGYGFIATGESGPQVLLLDGSDGPLVELGLAYDWGTAITEAHAALPEAIARVKRAGR